MQSYCIVILSYVSDEGMRMYQRSLDDLQRDVALVIWFLQREGRVPELAEIHSLYGDALRGLYEMPGNQESVSVWVKTAILYGLVLTGGKKPDWNSFVLRITVEPASPEIFQPTSRYAQRFYALLLTNMAIASCNCTFNEYKRYAGSLGEKALEFFAAIGDPITLRRWRAAALLARAYGAHYEGQDETARRWAEQALPLVPSSADNLHIITAKFLEEAPKHRRICWKRHAFPTFTVSDLYRFQES